MSVINEGYKCAEQTENNINYKTYLHYTNKVSVQILILFILTIILYANSINAPFYLDDFSSIVENQAIHDPTNITAIWQFSSARVIGYFSFALNYALDGSTSTTSYHIVNIFIHFLASVAVLLLFRGLLQTKKLTSLQTDSNTRKHYLLAVPLLTALFFLCAPLQTQAITYIIQRLASLAALFYIAALASYVYARLKQQPLLFLFTALFSLAAFFTKQNTATLPFALLLIELIFFQSLQITHWKKYIKISTISLGIVVLGLLLLSQFSLTELDRISRDPQTIGVISRFDYFATQLLVLWHYILRFFVPLNLHIEYDFPLQSSLPVLALLAHFGIIFIAFLVRQKQPLILFAVLFYYLAHGIESSFFPIYDTVFEHRAYLPNLSLALLSSILLVTLTETIKQKNLVWLLSLPILLWFSYLTIERNAIWNDPIKFYQNETRLSPNKERVWADLGKFHLKNKHYTEALQSFGRALNLGRDGNTLNALPTTFLNTYLALLYSGQTDKATYMETLIPVEQLTRNDKVVFYNMRGLRLSNSKQSDKAIHSFKKALKINPNHLDAKANLAAMYMVKQDRHTAKKLLNEVLTIKPSHKIALHYKKQMNDNPKQD